MIKTHSIFLKVLYFCIITHSLNSEIISATFKLHGLTCSECMEPLKRSLKEKIHDIKEVRSIHMKTGMINATLKEENLLTLDKLEDNIKNAIKSSQSYRFEAIKKVTLQGIPSRNGSALILLLSYTQEQVLLDNTFAETVEKAFLSQTSLTLLGTLSQENGYWKLSPH